MAENEKNTLDTTSTEIEESAQDVTNANTTVAQLDNKSLQSKYNEMHSKGKTAWFDDGRLERELILNSGDWKGKTVIEIGCGEGELSSKICDLGATVFGFDYSKEAIDKALPKSNDKLKFQCSDYKEINRQCDTLVLQGVLEHLDKPFDELDWMIAKFKPSTVITSSPCFRNIRGVVWKTLAMLGAVMSKTDIHYFDHYDFLAWSNSKGYTLDYETADQGWAMGQKMIRDLRQRIPLALKDGDIHFDQQKINNFIEWLSLNFLLFSTFEIVADGAVACYVIDINS